MMFTLLNILTSFDLNYYKSQISTVYYVNLHSHNKNCKYCEVQLRMLNMILMLGVLASHVVVYVDNDDE